MPETTVQKIQRVLKERKFWTLILSLVSIWTGVYTNTIPAHEAIYLTVAAFSTYTLGTAIDRPQVTK